jgi:hypothetical protein
VNSTFAIAATVGVSYLPHIASPFALSAPASGTTTERESHDVRDLPVTSPPFWVIKNKGETHINKQEITNTALKFGEKRASRDLFSGPS